MCAVKVGPHTKVTELTHDTTNDLNTTKKFQIVFVNDLISIDKIKGTIIVIRQLFRQPRYEMAAFDVIPTDFK
jgi:hypothetical protein